jgi:hypothetical protein
MGMKIIRVSTATEPEYSGRVEACCHQVDFRYWPVQADSDSELAVALTEEAESRAKAMISEGYHSGELNCLYEGVEYRGWWEISRT